MIEMVCEKLGLDEKDLLIKNLEDKLNTQRKYYQNRLMKIQQENKQLKEKIENLTTLVVCGDTKQIKNTAQYKLEQLQQRIDKIEKCIKEYKEWGYAKYDENEIEIELIDKILEIVNGGENNR